MNLRILEIASHTENNKVIENFTHKSKNKNPLCGDEMEISLVVKDDIVKDMGYQCKSCVYCQASVSLLSRKIKDKEIKACNEAGVTEIIEVRIGYDGIVFASDIQGNSFEFTQRVFT